jgi:phosphoribosylamine---glycine ligase
MKVLVVGSGGREHALCEAFARSSRVSDVFCAPGNAGITQVAARVAIAADNIEELAEFANAEKIDLTFVGGETALALGIVDVFAAKGLRVIGPTRKAAQLESSKAFAKDFMARHDIPTARYAVAGSTALAVSILESGDLGGPETPVVVKADGLAAGKGVVVARDRSEAILACGDLETTVGAAASEKIVLEECLVGKEISLLLFASGDDFAMMPATRDHKRIGDGDTGPNTGGMGAITDPSLLSAEKTADIVRRIVEPTLRGCIRDGFPFRGILFIGLMITAEGPKVLEYNVRFGDPETQAILVRLETDLAVICEAMLGTSALSSLDIRWKPGSSACVVLAAEGYPAKPRTGDRISGLDAAAARDIVSIFHAGTAEDDRGEFVTSGGRVLGVTATGPDLTTALAHAYAAVSEISWPGVQYRKDIGKTR